MDDKVCFSCFVVHYFSRFGYELSYASNVQRVMNEKGYWAGSSYWSGVVGTEVGHSISSLSKGSYGKRGDSNWEQIALVEGWANYIAWKMPNTYLSRDWAYEKFPNQYREMNDKLNSAGCSTNNMEKCLTAKTFSEYKQLLLNVYAGNTALSQSITTIIDKYNLIIF